MATFMPIDILSMPFDFPDLREAMMWHPTVDSDPIHRWLRTLILEEAALVSS